MQIKLVMFCVIHLVLACGAQYEAAEYHIPYNQSVTLACSGCEPINGCLITINDINATNETTPQNNQQFTLQLNSWENYGNVCCGADIRQRTCNIVCPPPNGKIRYYHTTHVQHIQ